MSSSTPAGFSDSSPHTEFQAVGIQSCLKQTSTENAEWRQRDCQRVKALRISLNAEPRRSVRASENQARYQEGRERVSTFASPQHTSTQSIPRLIDQSRSAPCRRDIDPSNIPSVSVTRSRGRSLCPDERNLEATRVVSVRVRTRTHAQTGARFQRPGLLTVNVGSVPPRTRCLPRIPKRRIRGFLLWTKL